MKLSFEGISAVAENVSIPPNSEVLTMGDVMSSVSEEILYMYHQSVSKRLQTNS